MVSSVRAQSHYTIKCLQFPCLLNSVHMFLLYDVRLFYSFIAGDSRLSLSFLLWLQSSPIPSLLHPNPILHILVYQPKPTYTHMAVDLTSKKYISTYLRIYFFLLIESRRGLRFFWFQLIFFVQYSGNS